MPVVSITLVEGYDEEKRQSPADTARATIAAPSDGATIIVDEVSKTDGYIRGRVARKPGASLPGQPSRLAPISTPARRVTSIRPWRDVVWRMQLFEQSEKIGKGVST